MIYKRTIVISADEKKILLARLQLARESKAAKAAAKKKETLADVKEPEPPAPAPATHCTPHANTLHVIAQISGHFVDHTQKP
jgi:hypothetical protein